MFSTQFTIWLTLSILALHNLIQLVSADIVYVPNWQIPYPGEPNDRVIYLVGDAHDYEVIASNYNGYQQSDARCETKLSEGHYSGPCLTTVQFHNQVFNIRDIKNPSNAVSVQFFVNGGATDHEAQIVTAGNCFGGFTNENVHAPLRKSGTSPIVGHGDRVSVVINCKSNSRGTYGVSN